jgi:hypothetical protein
MANLFEQRRDEHLKKSQAFLQEANNLFRDDLLYRSALADAVSAIKHSLQAYLWMRVAAVAAGDQRQRWQEIALDGSMPQMVRAAAEAGLDLGDSERTIRDLNDLRNTRTHDSPRSPITPEQAARAVQIARMIRERVVAGLPDAQTAAVAAARAGARTADPVRVAPGPSQAAPVVAAGVGSPARHTTAVGTAAVGRQGAAAPGATAGQAETAGEDDAGDEPPTPLRTRRGGWRAWWLLATAAALVVGVVAGSAVTYPVAAGHPPAWLSFATALGPATPTATPRPTATAVPSGPFFAGALVVTPSGCGISPATATLRNGGATAIAWAAGIPDAPAATFAPAPSGAAHPTAAGRLAPGASVTLTIAGLPSGGAHVVVIGDGGTVEVAVGGC